MPCDSSSVYRLQATSLLIIVSGIIFSAYAKPPLYIISGSNTSPGEITFQVSLRINGNHFCGGTIVSTRHVITAAHCVYELVTPYDDLTIVTGTNSLVQGGQSYLANDIEVHSKFALGTDGAWHDDIAIITVVGDIEVNTYQSPIALPDDDTPNNVVGLASGWVRDYFQGFSDDEISTILQKSTMVILSNNLCRRMHKNKFDDRQICGLKNVLVGTYKVAHPFVRGLGDDGSPLVYDGAVVGISSRQYPGVRGLPDVYTRVHHYRTWILDVMSRSFYEDFHHL